MDYMTYVYTLAAFICILIAQGILIWLTRLTQLTQLNMISTASSELAMAELFTTTISNRANISGAQFDSTGSIQTANMAQSGKVLPPAKKGTLTTKSSAFMGEITMEPGHGLITGDRVSIGWKMVNPVNSAQTLQLARRGVSITVTGDLVAFSAGNGNNIPDVPVAPAPALAMGVSVEVFEPFVLEGDNARVLLAKVTKPGTITLVDNLDAELWAFSDANTLQSKAFQWFNGSSFDSPIAAKHIAGIFYANLDISAPSDSTNPSHTNTLQVAIGYD